MPINQAEIKRAISLLSTVGNEDISGMEPEFFAAYARFSDSYKHYTNRQIAKDNARDWALSKLPPCPKCGEKNIAVCSPMVNFSSLDIYAYDKSKTVVIGTDVFDNVYFDSKDYRKLIEVVSTHAPEIAHLLVNHLSCYDCDVNYAATEELNSIIGNEVPFNTIVEWVNNKKDAE
jgi:hypothetical protein